MTSDNKRLHVFISHYHKDDAGVGKLTDLLNSRGHDVRNSSIRANPKNRERLNKGLVKEATIRRLLRMKISWAGAVVVLIGKNTHTRCWVDWEIDEAHKQGKRIVGVFARGGADADIPANLRKYGCECVAWNADSILNAIGGTDAPFEGPSGAPAPTPTSIPRSVC
jgi:MTH538 TIR-like domain (DUF1863)